jgi:Ser/Thr protein kinase RdoA (MazF antagonist)
MAVYTDITSPEYRNQLSEIERAFSIEITSITGIVLGSSDSMFKITAGDTESSFVLTIYETPDVTPAGLESGAAQIMINYLVFLAESTGNCFDKKGAAVNISIPKPLPTYQYTENQASFVELTFNGMKKSVSMVPYIEGKSFINTPEELAEPDEAYLAGRALGAYHTLALSYPEPELFPNWEFERFVHDVDPAAYDLKALERLGYVLSGSRRHGFDAEELGRDYLSKLRDSGLQLLEEWHRMTRMEPRFKSTLIHGDMFTDNVLIDDDNRLILLDFNETNYGPIGVDIGVALTSWASQHGKPILGNVLTFLQGYDGVTSLSSAQLSQIPLFVQVGAFRWEVFRVRRTATQDPRERSMRSPAEFRSIRGRWAELDQLFSGLGSIKDLAPRIGM